VLFLSVVILNVGIINVKVYGSQSISDRLYKYRGK